MQQRIRQSQPVPAWVTYILLGMIIVSLFLHLLTWLAFTQVRVLAKNQIQQLAVQLGEAQNSTLTADFPVSQRVPIRASIPVNKTLVVPVKTTVDVNSTVQVPLAGFNFDVPIVANIPIDTTVPISFQETVDVSTTVALDINIPIRIPIAETSIANYLEILEAQLRELAEKL